MKKIYITILLTTIILMSGFAQKSNLVFKDFDINGDGKISRSEFLDVFSAQYQNDLDYVDDKHLDDEDFYKFTYGMWDTDNDEYITQKEWLKGYDYYYGDIIVRDFNAVDVDGDGRIEYTEYHKVLDDGDLYSYWDLDDDSFLNQFELARSVFNRWDTDNSNFLEIGEYNAFDNYYDDI